MNKLKTIGIVGGIGPYAGLNLVRKIFDQTKANCDQDHLPISILSYPHSIPDRTEFLLGKSDENPAIAIAEVIKTFHENGINLIGMPCNTAHAIPIFSEIIRRIPKEVKLIHLIEKVSEYIQAKHSSVKKVGILSTTGTYVTKIYKNCLSKYDLFGVQVSEEIQKNYIHPAIYGIKSCSNPVAQKDKMRLKKGIEFLISENVEVIILGCSELPLAILEDEINGIPIIDSTKILARELILESAPEKLLRS